MLPRVRVNGVLMENRQILLVEQDVTQKRKWAHPGGKPEWGETLEDAVVREVQEETGLNVNVKRILYVTDFIKADDHRVIVAFEVEKTGGQLGSGQGLDVFEGKIKSARMFDFEDLVGLGFSRLYSSLVKSGFPERGLYLKNILDDE